MAEQYGKPVRYGRESAHKSRVAREQHHTWRHHAKRSTPSWRHRRSSARSGRSQQLWILPRRTVRVFFCVCASILSTLRFCQRRDFVNAEILSTREFFRSGNYVDVGILSTREFCRHGREILSTPIILSVPIFCSRQYFVCV
jgi:hypothetical protein